MPGEDVAEATRIVLGELPDLPHLPELPHRGPAATLTGRGVALLGGLGADLQPAGWRLTAAPGVDQRRARSLLGQDLDTLEEQAGDHDGALKVQVAGPWTLAATLDRPRGDRVLGDHGARRELVQSLAEGVAEHVGDLRRRFARARLVVQVDEPALPAVLAAAVPTASGWSRHRSVPEPEAAEALTALFAAITDAGAAPAVHCCATDAPIALLRRTGARALSVDATSWPPERLDEYAAALDEGIALWMGIVPSTDPARAPSAEDLTREVLDRWRDLGLSPAEAADRCLITPTCGLADASPAWARTAMALAVTVARNVAA